MVIQILRNVGPSHIVSLPLRAAPTNGGAHTLNTNDAGTVLNTSQQISSHLHTIVREHLQMNTSISRSVDARVLAALTHDTIDAFEATTRAMTLYRHTL
jgi:hypothetical protein